MAITLNGTTGITYPSGKLQADAALAGATVNALSSSALTLTNVSTQYQVVQITDASNNIVNLPDATTLSTEGFPIYLIENLSPTGTNLQIKNSAGTIIGLVNVSTIGMVTLVDNSTSAGQWRCTTIGSQNFRQLTTESETTANVPTNGQYFRGIVGLSATSFVRVFSRDNQFSNQQNTEYYFQAGTISGNTITYGTTATFTTTLRAFTNGNANVQQVKAVRLSNTSFAVQYGWTEWDAVASQRWGFNQFRTCTVSGTTITIGSSSSGSLPQGDGGSGEGIPNGNSRNGTITRLSDTSFAVVYNDGTTNTYSQPYNYSGSLAVQIVTVSGTTQTVGTKATLATSTYTQPISIVGVTSTQLFVAYSQASSAGSISGRTKLVTVTVSGTTATWNSPTTVESVNTGNIFRTLSYHNGAVSPTTTQVLYNSGYNTGFATISGTTVTYVNSPLNFNADEVYLSTSSRAYNYNNSYFDISANGFVTSSVTSVYSSQTATSFTRYYPLGSQPTTSLIGSIDAGTTVILGNTL